jgi:hypothetical protein
LYSPVEKEDAKPKPASPYLSGNYKVPHPKLGLLTLIRMTKDEKVLAIFKGLLL